MALDKLIVWNGDAIERRLKRSYKIAAPEADVDNGQPVVDARTARDLVLPLIANAITTADTSSLDGRTNADLDAIGRAEGIARPAAVGASGYVLASTATGGATIYQGDEWRPDNSQIRYQCAITGTYADGAQVPIVGLDVGPGTNLPAGATGEWSAPRSGCNAAAVVWAEGLTGGRDQADNEEYKALIIERRARGCIKSGLRGGCFLAGLFCSGCGYRRFGRQVVFVMATRAAAAQVFGNLRMVFGNRGIQREITHAVGDVELRPAAHQHLDHQKIALNDRFVLVAATSGALPPVRSTKTAPAINSVPTFACHFTSPVLPSSATSSPVFKVNSARSCAGR